MRFRAVRKSICEPVPASTVRTGVEEVCATNALHTANKLSTAKTRDMAIALQLTKTKF